MWSRRRLLAGGIGATLLGACSDNRDDSGDPRVTAAPTASATSLSTTTTSLGDGSLRALEARDFGGLGMCKLLPEATAGPFPLDRLIDRRDITEGYPGHPFRLGLRTVDARCEPVPGAVVEVWHADATGDYSAFIDGGSGKDESAGTTFMRGAQTAAEDGIVEFHTIYPGWYEGRAVHIHVRVHLGGELRWTGQMYFDEEYTRAVYATGVYAEFGNPDTSNEADTLAGDPVADGTLLSTSRAETTAGTGTLGLLNLVVGV